MKNEIEINLEISNEVAKKMLSKSALQKLITPTDIATLSTAIQLKEQILTDCNDSSKNTAPSKGELAMIQLQDDEIQTYIKSLGEYDSEIFANNVSYLCQKYNIRIGQLEDVLGISAGYISRTIGENSKKKMSVDTVWKIARLFDSDIHELTETKMWLASTSVGLLRKFIDRLYSETKEKNIEWKSGGGYNSKLSKKFEVMRLATGVSNEAAVYHPDHIKEMQRCPLIGDIMYVEGFNQNQDLAMVPYAIGNNRNHNCYDFLMIDQRDGRFLWNKVFYTTEYSSGILDTEVEKLYSLILKLEMEAKLDPKMQLMIKNYLKGGE